MSRRSTSSGGGTRRSSARRSRARASVPTQLTSDPDGRLVVASDEPRAPARAPSDDSSFVQMSSSHLPTAGSSDNTYTTTSHTTPSSTSSSNDSLPLDQQLRAALGQLATFQRGGGWGSTGDRRVRSAAWRRREASSSGDGSTGAQTQRGSGKRLDPSYLNEHTKTMQMLHRIVKTLYQKNAKLKSALSSSASPQQDRSSLASPSNGPMRDMLHKLQQSLDLQISHWRTLRSSSKGETARGLQESGDTGGVVSAGDGGQLSAARMKAFVKKEARLKHAVRVRDVTIKNLQSRYNRVSEENQKLRALYSQLPGMQRSLATSCAGNASAAPQSSKKHSKSEAKGGESGDVASAEDPSGWLDMPPSDLYQRYDAIRDEQTRRLHERVRKQKLPNLPKKAMFLLTQLQRQVVAESSHRHLSRTIGHHLLHRHRRLAQELYVSRRVAQLRTAQAEEVVRQMAASQRKWHLKYIAELASRVPVQRSRQAHTQ